MSRIVGILLCAGAGTRFGGDKLLAALPDGRALAQAACANLIAVVPETIAIVRSGDCVLANLLQGEGARAVPCECAVEGMGASLAFGVRCTPDADGWIVALGDMPWIRSSTIESVARALISGAHIAAPYYGGERGHPVAFSRECYASLSLLTGDRGARELLQSEAALQRIDCDDAGVLRDVDTPQQLV